MNRRTFLQQAAAASFAVGISPHLAKAATASSPLDGVHIFSKHLQFLDYSEMAAAAKKMGFDGVDLTVRPRGHVEPANAKRDLPRAAAALRDAGLPPVMCVTAFSDPDDPLFESTLDVIAESGFSYLRMGWFRFADSPHPAAQLEKLQMTARRLAKALADRGLSGGMQNHAGERYVGASAWEYWQILDGIDNSVLGLQFDIRHATAERGSSWRREVDVAAPNITSINFKDFYWEKPAPDARPRIVNTPLGEGWVDWPRFMGLLREHGVHAPASLHCEYEMGGAEKGRPNPTLPHAEIFRRIKRDLDLIRALEGAQG